MVLAHPDDVRPLCDLARSQGLDAIRVDRCEGLDAALEAAFASPRPNLVEVQVD